MANRFSNPFEQMFSTAVNFLSGGGLYFYVTGSSTPATTYADSALSTPNANPVPLDALGRHGAIFLVPAVTYKVVLKDTDGVTIGTADPIVDPAANVSAAFSVYAGNPTGNVAGNAGTVGGSGASVVWDITNHLLYVCSTTGTASTAVWSQIGSTLAGAIVKSSTITPGALNANTNDWSPTGGASASIWRISTSAAYNITGISVSQINGTTISLKNIGTFNITLTANDAASLAANRFGFVAAMVLRPLESITLEYDATSSLWRPASSPLAGLKNIQVFASGSGTYTPSAGATRGIVFVTGGGGGGGGAGSTSGAAAAGGGGGATGIAFISALASVAYAVDAGGSAGAATGGTGGAGGTSSFGTITAAGGSGGVGSTATGAGTSVAGGAGSATTANATFTIAGSAGAYGFVNNAAGVAVDLSGFGGGSYWGMGGASRPADSAGAGNNGVVPGSGGSGALRSGSNVAGGAGAPGIIVVIEF